MTLTGCTSVPSDDFFYQENSLLSLFNNEGDKRSVHNKELAAKINLDEKEESPCSCSSTSEDTFSDGHTTDGEVSITTNDANDGFYSCGIGKPTQMYPPDCYPVGGFGYGYNQTLSDVRAYTQAVLASNIEVFDAHAFGSIAEFARSRIDNGLAPGSFLICNMSTLTSQFNLWRRELPMIEPFYAVKCNPDPAILRVLASLGCGFDCATMGEIDLVLNGLGDSLSFGRKAQATNKIVYANPAKMVHMIEYAINNEVQLTVFDGEDELYKMASLPGHEKLKLLLRLTTDDKDSVCRFSKKFGCPVEEAEALLEVAKELGLHVAGVSFHVGSGCGDAHAYTKALSDACSVFKLGEQLGMEPMTVIDIGGGFPGDNTIYGADRLPNFTELASAIRNGISTFLGSLNRSSNDIRFIAEPGRFFVSSSTTIVTKVYSRKGGKQDFQALYVDDGVYGSFNNVVYDHALPVPKKLDDEAEFMRKSRLAAKSKSGENVTQDVDHIIPTAVFGPTCDGLDQMCSLENTKLNRCQVGDWLIWENQGAYTHTASFVFNGYTHVPCKFYVTV